MYSFISHILLYISIQFFEIFIRHLTNITPIFMLGECARVTLPLVGLLEKGYAVSGYKFNYVLQTCVTHIRDCMALQVTVKPYALCQNKVCGRLLSLVIPNTQWMVSTDHATNTGSSRLCNWLSLRRLVPWMNHLPPVCWSTFWKCSLRW